MSRKPPFYLDSDVFKGDPAAFDCERAIFPADFIAGTDYDHFGPETIFDLQ